MGMNQLKKALMDAGLVTKKDMVREKVKKQHKKGDFKMKKDQIRIVCDACGKTAPDVERYDHTNRQIQGKWWLCIPCADEYCVDDKFRMTNQSTSAKTKMFSRRYGRTKRF
jgi:hypothetical protein